MNVLIIADDVLSGAPLAQGLTAEGFDVTLVDDDDDPLETACATNPGAILFDTGAPDIRDYETCRALRRKGRTEPILFLSTVHGAIERAHGLNAGADDYIAKPFQFAELVERLRAHMMHRSIADDVRERVQVGRLMLDMHARQAYFSNVHIRLTQREAELLAVLMKKANHPVRRDEIYDELWRRQSYSSLNVVNVYVGYLRTKFAEITRVGGPFIVTVRGRGFMLDMAGYRAVARQ